MTNVAIVGVPRSGTSWVGQIFNSSPQVAYRFQPLFSYAFKGRLCSTSSSIEIENFHSEILKSSDDFINQTVNISGNKLIEFTKEKPSHLVWKEVRYLNIVENLLKSSNTKVIGVLRHPGGVINSWQKAPKEFNKEWSIEEQWMYAQKKNEDREEEFYGYAKWKEVANSFITFKTKYPDQFTLLNYEKLNTEPNQEVKRVFNFVGLCFSDQTKKFIDQSTNTHSNDPYGVMRANNDIEGWSGNLNEEIQKAILGDPGFQSIQSKLDLW